LNTYINVGAVKSFAGFAMLFPLALSSAVHSEELTAGVAMEVMNKDAFGGYVQGIVEGMAQARYEQDGNTDGMQCIYEWYYQDGGKGSAKAVIDGFHKYPNHSPGAVMSGLIRKECPP
jgi:hypothetical protein